MGELLRYIMIVIILYVVGMEIYKSVRTRTFDYLLWVIVGLFGIVIWLSRGFLITCQMYDLTIWVVCLLTISNFIVPKQSKASRWVKGGALLSLSLAVISFISLDIIATRKDSIAIETSLNGYSTVRIDEIYFRFNDKSFGRNFNLEEYSDVGDLRKVYYVELSIIPITAEIAKIESLDLVSKHNLIERKGGKR